jgi:twitching motility protein PilT
MVDIINTRRRCNIITLEDPVEYLHRHKLSNVNQREIGVDTDSFPEGLRYIFREAPDVIVIGEMRDPESFGIALQAADTGHLVISCVHANNAVQAVDRIVDVFPPEQHRQIRNQLSENLLLVINQRLVPSKDGRRRLLAYEKLTNSYRVRNLIREAKEHQIRSLLQQSPDDFWSIDLSLAYLVADGRITQEVALQFCQDAAFLRLLLERGPASVRTQGR